MLGERIRQQRSYRGWGQASLAKQLNVTKQTISNWENDNIQPSIEMLIRLSSIFGVTTDYLLGLDQVPRLNVEGLPADVVAHLLLLIDDLRK